MKKTTREEVCWLCKQFKQIIQSCSLCHGKGIISLKETIEESDDMREFIEKKLGWELVEGKERVFKYSEPYLRKTNNCHCWVKIEHIPGLECDWGGIWKEEEEKNDQF